jgi:hypothetical protein
MLDNSGGCPALDIDVFLHFPNGFHLFSFNEQPKFVKEPTPPELPFPFSLARMSNLSAALFQTPALALNSRYTASNVSDPSIKKTNSYDVKLKVNSLKHKCNESLGKYVLIFDSYETASTFQIKYELNAENVPPKICNSLLFEVAKE